MRVIRRRIAAPATYGAAFVPPSYGGVLGAVTASASIAGTATATLGGVGAITASASIASTATVTELDPGNAFLIASGEWLRLENGDTLAQEGFSAVGAVTAQASAAGTATVTLGGTGAITAAASVTATATNGATATFSTETGDNVVIGMTAWAATTALGSSMTMGSIVGWFRTNASKLYYASAGGTTGSTAPTHSSGTVSDGTINWEYCCAVDYTTMAAWIAALPATLTAPKTGIIWAAAEITISAVVDFGSHATTSVNFITLKAKEELAFYSHATTTLRYNTAKGLAIRQTDNYANIFTTGNVADYTRVKGLQLKLATTASDGRFFSIFGNNVMIDRCLMENPARNQCLVFSGSMRNSLVIVDNAATGGECIESQNTSKMTNCTIVRPSNRAAGGVALRNNYGSLAINNSIVAGFTTAPVGTVTGEYNASTNATAIPSGTGNVTITTYANEFVQSSSASSVHDFKLVTGAVSKNAGATDTTNVPDSKDILGTTRSTWDIGAHEFV